jgi:hypothetical protein
MFIGHFGMGLAAKKIDHHLSLGTLFLASQLIDLLWPIFLLVGLERVKVEPGNTPFTPLNFIYYPFSHSLLSVFLWAIVLGLIYFLLRKNLKSSVVLSVLVMSHWILDLITHRPDLPLSPWTKVKVGLGLWNSITLTMLIEGLIFLAGAYLYLKTTRAKNTQGTISLWSLFLFLIVVYLLNIFGSPPPSEKPIAIIGLLQWLIVAWGYWIDKNRNVNNQR